MTKLYTCDEVAQRYGVKVITVWNWIRKSKITAIKIGKSYRLTEEDLQSFELNARKRKEE